MEADDSVPDKIRRHLEAYKSHVESRRAFQDAFQLQDWSVLPAFFLRHLSHTSPSNGLFSTKGAAQETWLYASSAADLGRDASTEQLHVQDIFSTVTPLLAKPNDGRETDYTISKMSEVFAEWIGTSG